MSYEVQTLMFDVWENCWTEDERPCVFDSRDEAEDAITDHLADVAEAVRCGDMAEEYSRYDYRVVEVSA